MPTEVATRAGQILSARTLADPGRRKAWERISKRILERLPEVRADHERAAESWRRLTGEEMPATGDEWAAAASRYGIVAECVADGDFTRQAVFDAMTRTRLRQQDADGVRGANHADAERKPGGGGRGKNDETITAKLVAEWPSFQENYNEGGKASHARYVGHFIHRWPTIAARAMEQLRKDAAEEQREPEALHMVFHRWLESGLRSARG